MLFGCMGGFFMHRIAVLSIIAEDKRSSEAINKLLHQYGEFIVGRMGIPYKRRSVNIISVVLDAPQEVVSALSGKLGALAGVTVKASYSKETYVDE